MNHPSHNDFRGVVFMRIKVIRACKNKNLAQFRVLLILCLCAIIIFGFAVIRSIGYAFSPKNSYESGRNMMTTVIIDPGHGGEDGGAVGVGGVVEKNINLDISLKLRDYFKASGFNVVMTRDDDRSIYDDGCKTIKEKKVSDIHNREKLIKDYPNCIFISIHQNKFEESKYSGTQVFYSKNNRKSEMLAKSVQNQVKISLQPDNERLIKPSGSNLYILYHTKVPAIMAECGFLSNPTEAKKLQDSEYQDQMAFSIYSGALKYVTMNEYND